VAIDPSGAVQLNVKVGYWMSVEEQSRKLRSSKLGHLQVTQHMEYYSNTLGRWIPCRITAVEPNGAVQLDVKAGYSLSVEEQAQKLRLPTKVDVNAAREALTTSQRLQSKRSSSVPSHLGSGGAAKPFFDQGS